MEYILVQYEQYIFIMKTKKVILVNKYECHCWKIQFFILEVYWQKG